MNTPDLSFTVEWPIPKGQNFVQVSGVKIPFIPSSAGAVTMSGSSDTVIWASADLTTLTNFSCLFNLSGAPIDGNQVLIATFYGYSQVQTGVSIPNPGSQLDRALCAYLIAAGVGKWKLEETGDVVVLPADGLAFKTYPNITVMSMSSQHTPMLTGIEEFQTHIICKFSVAGALQQDNPYAVRVARDQTVGLVMAAMMQSSDNATLDATAVAITAAGRGLALSGTAQQQANNADMANFTCQHLYYLGTVNRGKPDEDGCDWVEIRGFRIIVSPTFLQ